METVSLSVCAAVQVRAAARADLPRGAQSIPVLGDSRRSIRASRVGYEPGKRSLAARALQGCERGQPGGRADQYGDTGRSELPQGWLHPLDEQDGNNSRRRIGIDRWKQRDSWTLREPHPLAGRDNALWRSHNRYRREGIRLTTTAAGSTGTAVSAGDAAGSTPTGCFPVAAAGHEYTGAKCATAICQWNVVFVFWTVLRQLC